MTAQLPRFITGRITQLTTEEKTRRAVALTIAEAHRRKEGASHQFEVVVGARAGLSECPIGLQVPTTAPPVPSVPSGEGIASSSLGDEAPAPEAAYQAPVVTITISGLPGSGKTTLTHIIRTALAREGIATQGPEHLRSIAWHKAIAVLINRGLSVILVKAEDEL